MKRFFFALLLVSGALISGCKDDPCENISCGVFGECVNGECSCDEGYTGPDCTDQQTPSSMLIRKLTVSNFRLTEPDGGGWDLTDGADVYATLTYENDQEIWNATTFFEDSTPGGPSWDINTSIDPTRRMIVRIYDFDDFDADDYMMGINFKPYDNNNGFPSTLPIEFEGFKIDLDVTYEFN